MEKVNEIAREKIAVEVEFVPFQFGQWFGQYSLFLSGTEDVDILVNYGGFLNAYSQGACYDLTDLLAQYGQDIVAMEGDYLKGGVIDGRQYALPIYAVYSWNMGIIYRQDVVEELGLQDQVAAVKTLADWEPILAAVKEAKPDMTPFVTSSGSTAPNFQYGTWDDLGNKYGVLMNGGETSEVVNLFETDEYARLCSVMHDWNVKGYSSKDIQTQTDGFTVLTQSDAAFCTLGQVDFNTPFYQSTTIGKPINVVQLAPAVGRTYNNVTYIVMSNTKHPEAAMKFLNLWFSDIEVGNLIKYLPLTEYIPDGEPHVFGDRLYIYGSHDRAGGTSYCEDHYSVWSAPVNDLRDWRCDGVSYRRSQDPSNERDDKQLWAPDVTRGPDGRYYLYYCFSFYPEIGVAVSDSPAGPFEFLGHVHYPPQVLGGKLLQEGMVFDPAVLTDDDGRVYLYYGFAPACEKEVILPRLSEEELAQLPPDQQDRMREMASVRFGEYSMVAELEPDMLTVKSGPKELIPGGHHTDGTGFEGHGFFEASSIRKLGGKYYFVYSSHKSHELCYAVSDRPDGGFVYGGTVVSNGDIGLDGREHPVYPLGNNHGGLVQIGDALYIFYHRQTNATEFSRQGCAERVELRPDGSIPQTEITSCGLNGGPLPAAGSYPAAIACHLTDPSVANRIDYSDPAVKDQIRITQRQNRSYITGIKDGSVVGWKYFDFVSAGLLALELRGSFSGDLCISHDPEGEILIGEMELETGSKIWRMALIPIVPLKGKQPLYIRFAGKGTLDFKTLCFFED